MEHRKNQCGLCLSGQTENKVMTCKLNTHAGVKVIPLKKHPLAQGKSRGGFLKLRNIGVALLFAPLTIGVVCNPPNIRGCASRKDVRLRSSCQTLCPLLCRCIKRLHCNFSNAPLHELSTLSLRYPLGKQSPDFIEIVMVGLVRREKTLEGVLLNGFTL